MGEVALAALRRKRVNLIVWAAILAALVAIVVAFYPSIKGDASLDKTFADFPAAVRAFLGTNSLVTPVGYLTGRLFAAILPGTLIGFTIGRGAAAIAGEEEQHTLNLTLAHPVARRSVLFERLAAMSLELFVLAVAAWLPLVVLSGPSDLDVGVRYETIAVVESTILAAVFGIGALAVGAWTGKRSVAMGTASAVAVAGYIVDSLARVVDVLKPLRPFTVWRWYSDHQPLTEGFDVTGMVVLILLSVALVVIGLVRFERRDIRE